MSSTVKADVGTAVASAVASLASRPDNQLSATAVQAAAPEIAVAAEKAINASLASDGVAIVNVKSAFQSKINIGGAVAALALLANFLKFFGIEVDAETQAAVASVIGGAFIVYAWVMRTWFSSTVTASSVK